MGKGIRAAKVYRYENEKLITGYLTPRQPPRSYLGERKKIMK